ncbi:MULTISPECIES: RHS repeat-associated core domain-containing protein [Myroides]|uniref:RHS repeat-associated core domain-containing protein n=1 Tax=Myroides TaxID=76831 RepID=UPI00141371D6|nr:MULTISPECIES: RHS repeat-associated core domain-containing protein [Myroides]UVD80385.1 hypothetical protein NWE55_03695 [Myroides albus]
MPSFRQFGQYEDVELNGLYYNRFRYYDSTTGLYISKGSIGLAGNNPTMYAYVWDSNGQVDVFGLITSEALKELQSEINSVFSKYVPDIKAIDPDAIIGYR